MYYVTDNGIIHSGAKALKILKERNPKRFATSITRVRWSETYDIRVETKHYEVTRSRGTYRQDDWQYNVHSVSNRERRWCDPDKPTHKRVVAELLKLIEV